jgi:hypothetical protein
MAWPKGKPRALTSGRKKGSLNKTFKAAEVAAKYGFDPLETLMKFAAGDWEGLGYDSEVYHMEQSNGATQLGYVITPNMRLQATKEVAQYLYPKRKEQEEIIDDSVDVTPENEKQAAVDALKYIESKFPDLLKKDE